MNAPPVIGGPASTSRALRRLFLALFLRGQTARGLRKQTAPKSIVQKLALVLVIYTLVGLVALAFLRKPVFALSAYLHAMTFALLGMFVAASCGEILFNKLEPDILLHRPVTASQMLWAKIRVLVEVSLWLAGAFNLVGLFAGLGAQDGSWLFPFVHAASTAAAALFCVSFIVVAYQLCLRWAGRERLDAVMTACQVIIAIGSILASQMIPRLIDYASKLNFNWDSWWIALVPPAWFAGLDDALAGSHSLGSCGLAGVALAATAVFAWLAFSRLAGDYERGLQDISEAPPAKTHVAGRRRLLDRLVAVPPLSWWLRDAVSRAGFLLTGAYLWRDRDVKLRVYPGLAPMLIMPFVVVFPHGSSARESISVGTVAFGSAYLGLAGMFALDLVRYSQQWQAADIFRCAPVSGPAQLCHGVRRAVLLFLAGPLVLGFIFLALVFSHNPLILFAALPGVISLPVFAMIANLNHPVGPFSEAPESASAAGRFLLAILSLLGSGVITGLTVWSWKTGWFGWFLSGELLVCAIAYFLCRQALNHARWKSLD